MFRGPSSVVVFVAWQASANDPGAESGVTAGQGLLAGSLPPAEWNRDSVSWRRRRGRSAAVTKRGAHARDARTAAVRLGSRAGGSSSRWCSRTRQAGHRERADGSAGQVVGLLPRTAAPSNHLATMLASTVSLTDPDLRGAGRRCRSGACRRSAMRSAEHARGIEGCGNEDSRAPSTRAGSLPRANADSLGLALEADRSHGRRCRRWSVWPHFHPDQLRIFINTLAWCKFRNNTQGRDPAGRDRERPGVQRWRCAEPLGSQRHICSLPSGGLGRGRRQARR